MAISALEVAVDTWYHSAGWKYHMAIENRYPNSGYTNPNLEIPKKNQIRRFRACHRQHHDHHDAEIFGQRGSHHRLHQGFTEGSLEAPQ